MQTGLKVAIVQDVIFRWGGAEKVLSSLLEIFPHSHIYTLLISENSRKKITDQYPRTRINSSIFQIFEQSNLFIKYLSVIKTISWLYWKGLRLNNYDIIISISHSFGSKAVRSGSHSLHIPYILTPPRYLYDFPSDLQLLASSNVISYIFKPIKSFLRYVDRRSTRHLDFLVAISKTVQYRISRIYRQRSYLIYPPVEVPTTLPRHISNEYYLTISRFVKSKNLDLVIQTCNEFQLPLFIVGEGPEENNLKKIAGPTIKFVGSCSDSQKANYFSRAKAFIHAAVDEDFGIAPVEAMGYGVPVIAHFSGGLIETVIAGKTGVFFRKQTSGSIKYALDRLDKTTISPLDCYLQAKKFSKEIFQKRFMNFVSNHLQYYHQ